MQSLWIQSSQTLLSAEMYYKVSYIRFCTQMEMIPVCTYWALLQCCGIDLFSQKTIQCGSVYLTLSSDPNR